MVIIKKAIYYLKEVTFIWHAKILESNAWMHLQKVISIGQRSRRYLKQIVLKISCQLYRSQKMDQTVTSSLANKVQQNPIPVWPSTKAKETLEVKEDPSTSKLPIIFLHNTNSDYLKYSLGQAKRSNPESAIYLIGNDSNDCYNFVEHHSFSNYFQGAIEFSKIYKHYNTTSYKYEVFCFQRWYILLEFLVSFRLL